MKLFKPMTKEEAESSKSNLFDPGVYDFEVIEAEEKTSTKGNEMFAVVLQVTINDLGETAKLRDWILLDGPMAWKLREFTCDCLGMEKQYASGQLDAEDIVGRFGKVETGHSEDGRFNEVVRYVDRREKTPVVKNAEALPKEVEPDEIPV